MHPRKPETDRELARAKLLVPDGLKVVRYDWILCQVYVDWEIQVRTSFGRNQHKRNNGLIEKLKVEKGEPEVSTHLTLEGDLEDITISYLVLAEFLILAQ